MSTLTDPSNIEDLHGWVQSSIGMLASHEDQIVVDSEDAEYVEVIELASELFDVIAEAVKSLRRDRAGVS